MAKRKEAGGEAYGVREELPTLPFGSPADDAVALSVRQINAQGELQVCAAGEREIRRYEHAQWDGVIRIEIPVKRGVAQRVDTKCTIHEKKPLRKAA